MTKSVGEPGSAGRVGEVASLRSNTYLLTLFVAGQSVRTERAVANLRRICARLGDRCELTIVDVLERPELAEREKILATPTVIRNRPLPRRRVIGDLSDQEKVVLELDLSLPANDAEVDATS
jgi:circadian clock protein KaiB